MSKPLHCYYAISGLNYKNGFATTCPISSARLQMVDDTLPSKFLNNEKFKEYRLMLESGEWPEHCNLCQTAEAEGTRSMRHDYEPDLTYYNPSTGEIDLDGLKHVEMRFSNSCNMACLHCSEVYSSQWGSRLKDYTPDQDDWDFNLEQLLKTQHREGPEDNTQIRLSKADAISIAQDLIDNFPNIEKLDFAGGEVLYQKQFFPVLEKLAEHPNAKNMYIFFHSNFNAQFDVEKLSKLLEPFGETKIKISIDSGTNIYSYFRDGDWDVLKKNVEKFTEINKTTHLDAVCTTSIYQMLDIKNIIVSLASLNVNMISLSTVFTPKYINPAISYRMFGSAILDDINETLRSLQLIANERFLQEDHKEHRAWDDERGQFRDIEGAVRDIAEIKNYIQNHKTSSKDVKAFINYANKMDKLWNQNFNNCYEAYTLTDTTLIRHNSYNFDKEYPYKQTDINKEVKNCLLEYKEKIDYVAWILQRLNSFPLPEEVLDLDKNTLQEMSETISNGIKKLRNRLSIESKVMIDQELDKLKIVSQNENYTPHLRYSSYFLQRGYACESLEEEIKKLAMKREMALKLLVYKSGIKQFKQDNVNIPFNPDWKRIAVNLSGGADSALLTLLLCKHIEHNNIDCKIDIITHQRVWNIRPWAGTVSLNVYNKLKEKWPNIIEERITNYVPPELEHSTLGNIVEDRSGDQIIVQSYNDFLAQQNDYNAIFNATTKNPSMDNPAEDRMLNRDHTYFPLNEFMHVMNSYWKIMPLIATEKDWVIKQYKDLDMMDIYDITRSCEGDGRDGGPLVGKDYLWYKYSDEEIVTCGKCFWCVERKWAEEQNEL